MSRYRDAPTLCGVLELPVASNVRNQTPTVVLNEPDDLADLHRYIADSAAEPPLGAEPLTELYAPRFETELLWRMPRPETNLIVVIIEFRYRSRLAPVASTASRLLCLITHVLYIRHELIHFFSL